MMAETKPKQVPDGPASVFVSYSRDDRKAALPIIELLEQAGFTVWWDGLLTGGERFSLATEAALEAARVVVVLWSRTSTASHWVHDEATRGRDRRVLVPLSLDGSEAPLGFRQFQTIDISKAKLKRGDVVADAVIKAVTALHDAAPVVRAPTPPVAARGIDRRLLLGGGGAVLGLAAGGAWWAGLFNGSGAMANSVAVLPFDNLGGDPQQSYFSDGLAAEVRGELARNPLLRVAAQASSNKFRDSSDDARAISRALGVTYLLDGNVRRAGDTLRISAELIDGSSGFSQWSQSFDRPLADVFAVQDEIAGAVTAALSAQMVRKQAGDSDASRTGGTGNVAAYDAYLRGRDLYQKGIDESSDRAALARFDEAIAADPRYALAHAARARALTVIGNQYSQGAARISAYDDALAAARRAVALGPDSAEASLALGIILFNGKLDCRGARAPFERAEALGGGDADVLSRTALFNARTGRFDTARNTMARAAALDPLNANTLRLVGEVEFSAGRHAEAIAAINRALAINPRLAVAHSTIGASQLQLGDIGAAERSFRAESNSLFALPGIAIICARTGRKPEAQAALARLIADHGDNGLYQQAQVLAQWGDSSAALTRLAEARQVRDAGLALLRNDPMLAPLRSKPAFIALSKSLGFD
jgi:TolB-like protein/tetratricopeptide (TPR) repeat protein